MSTRRQSTRPSAAGATSAAPTPSTKKSASAASARKRRRGPDEEEETNPTNTADTQPMVVDDETEGEEEEKTGGDTAASGTVEIEEESKETRTVKKSRFTAPDTTSYAQTPVRPISSYNSPTSPLFDPDTQIGQQPLLRTKRMEEKNELQELNKRLELYIMRQRERDATQGGLNHEIQILKERFLTESITEKKHHDARYEELKKQKLELSNQLQELHDDHAKIAQQSKDNLTSSNLYKHRCGELEKRLKKVEGDLAEANKKNIELENQVKKLSVDYQRESESHVLLKNQLENQKNALLLAQKQLNVVQSKANSAQQDLEALQLSSAEESAVLNKQFASLRKENQSIEAQLRREFGAQLKNLIAEYQEKNEKEKEAYAAKLKENYDTSLEEKNEQIRRSQTEIEKLQQETLECQRELEKERKSNSSAAAIRADYERQIAKLHEVSEQTRMRFEEQLQSKTETITRSSLVIATKEREFQELMDIKIGLDMEIAQYQKLLEEEEDRNRRKYGGSSAPVVSASNSGVVATPARARQSTPGRKSTTTTLFTESTTSSSSARRQSSATNIALGISISVNSSSHKITLTNSNGEGDDEENDIDLSGYSLVGLKSKQSFELADVNLVPGGSLVVVIGSGRAPAASKNNFVQKWSDANEDSFWVDGESLQLKDGKGTVVQTVQIRV